MIPIFCYCRLHFLAGTQLNRVRAANEYGAKNETASGGPKISTSIHATTVPLAEARATDPRFPALATVAMLMGNVPKLAPS